MSLEDRSFNGLGIDKLINELSLLKENKVTPKEFLVKKSSILEANINQKNILKILNFFKFL